MKIKPEYAEGHYNLGLALRESGKSAEAKEEFDRAYELAPQLRSRR